VGLFRVPALFRWARRMSAYEQIKKLAKEHGCRAPQLLALAPKNDPFYVGSPGQLAKARWFAALWERFGYTTGVHLRRVHYQLVSPAEADRIKADGLPYENTDRDWEYLLEAGKFARHLGLVDPAAFVDRRNPAPHVFLNPEEGERLGWDYYFPSWELPEIETNLVSGIDWGLPEFEPLGYEYRVNLQPYHVEVWCEKSTMNDLLLPLCRGYGVNLVTGLGYMSITSVINLLGRVSELGKPCRILYISEFDPAGGGMPTSVARHIEYVLHKEHADADVRLDNAMLTARQVEEYSLPRMPIKATDRRKANFEAAHGAGAVELDALEALHPGEFVRLLQERIEELRDDQLSEKVGNTLAEAELKLQDEWEAWIGIYQPQLDELKENISAIAESYQERLEGLNASIQAELEPHRERLGSLRQAVQGTLEAMKVDLPPLPEGEAVAESDGWLFDSRRGYFVQLGRYKGHRNGA